MKFINIKLLPLFLFLCIQSCWGQTGYGGSIQCSYPNSPTSSSKYGNCPAGRYCDVYSQQIYTSTSGGSTGFSAFYAYCRSCQAGTYQGASAQVYECTNCAAGLYSLNGAAACTSCSAGQYNLGGSSSCLPCTPGTFSVSGASVCQNCPVGQYSSSFATVCTTCA